jgi:hypothetical protein
MDQDERLRRIEERLEAIEEKIDRVVEGYRIPPGGRVWFPSAKPRRDLPTSRS